MIIPTPRQLSRLPGPGRTWRRGSVCRLVVTCDNDDFAVQFLRDRLRKDFGLRVSITSFAGMQKLRPVDVLLDTRAIASPNELLADALAMEQGYVVHAHPQEPAVLRARAGAGLLYAAGTFLQLLETRDEGVHLPDVDVCDWPEYRWRGNSWLIHGERNGWSYGRGDGARAYERRVVRKLDLCAMHKINFLHFHGFDWDVDRFPGYASMMRRLNHEARLRGIRLSFGGEAGFQAGFTNRMHYPDGEEYPCIGYKDNEGSRLCGTCRSNHALLELFLRRMETFVREIQPGAIYLHSIDTGTFAESEPIWNYRCPACRRRWPNDAIIAPDGMAGAYAAFYDAVAQTIHGVDPDCLLTVVSPVYTGWEESDADWRQASEYWLTVSRCLRDRTIQIGLREQFKNQGDGKLRLPELRRRLDQEGHGHRISSLFFFGGDNFYNGHPFLAAPIVSNYLRGSELVVNGNGTAYQEPQQLLNAECLWNPNGSRYFTPPEAGRESLDALRQRFLRLSNGIDRPRGIWGPDGFLDDACNRLYGPKAGPLVARLYRLRGRTKLGSPSFARCERTFIWMPVYHYLHPFTYSRAFRHGGVVWRKERSREDQVLSRRLMAVYRETSTLNRQAATLARRAARLCTDAHAAADLRWMADTLDAARRCADLYAMFVELFIRVHRAATTGRDKRGAAAAMVAFSRRAVAFDRAEKKKLPARFLPDESELTARQKAVAKLEIMLNQMRQTLATGHWP